MSMFLHVCFVFFFFFKLVCDFVVLMILKCKPLKTTHHISSFNIYIISFVFVYFLVWTFGCVFLVHRIITSIFLRLCEVLLWCECGVGLLHIHISACIYVCFWFPYYPKYAAVVCAKVVFTFARSSYCGIYCIPQSYLRLSLFILALSTYLLLLRSNVKYRSSCLGGLGVVLDGDKIQPSVYI